MTGKIFDIQRYSVHDGPGIRTTVFLAGCGLRCFWCHNPESFEAAPRLQFFEAKCVGCGKCVGACARGCHAADENGRRVIDRAKCAACGACAAACWAGALSMTVRVEDSARVLATVALDKPFYKGKGGMTVSGGEPLLQAEFTAELLKGAKARGIHTAVDTAGFIPYAGFKAALPYADLFLYDIKCMDEETHRRATGVSNGLILENLERLSAEGAKIAVRIPVIPGVNNTPENMEQTAAFLRGLPTCVESVELLNFHKLGGGKYEPLGMAYPAADLLPLGKDELRALAAPFTAAGIKVA